MIRLEKLTKTFRRDGRVVPILRNVTFEVPRGPGLALIGRNGAGKSTLLRLVAGTTKPDHGRVVTDERVSWPMGFSGGFHPALTGAQNTRFVARIHGRDPGEMAARVEAFAELGDAWHQRIERYSTGMKARLAFAVSMAVDFDTYLVDEIIGVGDAAFRRKCADVFRQRAGRSRVIMVSHNPATLRQFCQSALVLERGHLTWHAHLDTAFEHLDRLLLTPPLPA